MLPDAVCFVAPDFRFFFRHFRPAIIAARLKGLRAVAFLPQADEFARDGREEMRVVDSPLGRQSLSLLELLHQTHWLISHLRHESPRILVVFSLRSILIAALALPFVRVSKVIFVVTGLGVMDLVSDRRTEMLRRFTYAVLRAVSHRKSCHFIFENPSDARKIGFPEGQPTRQVLLMGAGVDPLEFDSKPFPEFPPFRFATVSRLVWSKGIDIAAQAISELAQEGYPVELDVYGQVDVANPYPFGVDGLSGLTGVHLRGHTEDVSGIWENHHAGIFASRGGEGLPRALLEAAACGRPAIVTNVAGCVDFIRDGIEGYVVPANSVPDLKEAIKRLIADPGTIRDLGLRSRDRVLRTSTVQLIQKKYEELFETERERECGSRRDLGGGPSERPPLDPNWEGLTRKIAEQMGKPEISKREWDVAFGRERSLAISEEAFAKILCAYSAASGAASGEEASPV